MNEKNIKKLSENISSINVNFNNIEKNFDDLINNKVISFIKSKTKNFDELLNEKNNDLKDINNNMYFEENKKLIGELNEQKSKIVINNNEKFDNLKNKNNILEERIKNLMEEKKVIEELNESKNKELEKSKRKIKNLNDKIYDINAYINLNCSDENFKKKLCNTCQLEFF